MEINYSGIASASLATILLLTACGGGSESGNTSNKVTSTLSFPLQSAYKATIASGWAKYLTVSGDCIGQGSRIISPAANTTNFEGSASLFSAEKDVISFTSGCVSFSSYYTNYYNNNYDYLGDRTVGSYEVNLLPFFMPTSVKVGNSGDIGTTFSYTDSTKAIKDGFTNVSYVIEADTSTTAIFNRVSKKYTNAGTLDSTTQERFLLSETGPLTPLYDSLASTSLNVVITYDVGGAVPVSNVVATANAGSNVVVTVESTATLDGSKSKNSNGIPTTFKWSVLNKPLNSNATLIGATTVYPTITPDVAGVYDLQLVINDGFGDSAPSTVTVTAVPPTANAGKNIVITVGSSAMLDGSSSTISGGSPTQYLWSIVSKPANSNATLVGASTVNPTITPDVAGVYYLQLTASIGINISNPSNVTVTAVPYGKISLGSSQSDVLLFQGTPKSVTNAYAALGYIRWAYGPLGLTTIDISTSDNTVLQWNNYDGILNVTMVAGKNITTSTNISIGSTMDDVIRLQGAPKSVTNAYSALGYIRWAYGPLGLTTIDISTSDNTVLQWNNYDGILKL